MERKDKKRSAYFQSIASCFIELRGAPFFLSSKELDCIAQWEKMEIPLSVVLDGIKRSFENSRAKPGRKGKILSLTFCNFKVLKAFEQHKERKVGHREKREERRSKKRRAREDIQNFLDGIPGQVGFLRNAFSRAQKILSRRSFSRVDEEKLEQIEEEIETLLLTNCDEKEKKKVKKEVLADYGFNEEEFNRIFQIKTVKVLRDKYKIPYVSLFYY